MPTWSVTGRPTRRRGQRRRRVTTTHSGYLLSMSLIILILLIAGALLLGFRTFWGQPAVRPDPLAGGLLCWIVAYLLERVS